MLDHGVDGLLLYNIAQQYINKMSNVRANIILHLLHKTIYVA
jgi:hypothetical protein